MLNDEVVVINIRIRKVRREANSQICPSDKNIDSMLKLPVYRFLFHKYVVLKSVNTSLL